MLFSAGYPGCFADAPIQARLSQWKRSSENFGRVGSFETFLRALVVEQSCHRHSRQRPSCLTYVETEGATQIVPAPISLPIVVSDCRYAVYFFLLLCANTGGAEADDVNTV